MPVSPVSAVMAEFEREYSAVLAQIREEIVRALPRMTRFNYKKIIERILRKYNVKVAVQNALMSQVAQVVSASTAEVLAVPMVKDAVLSRQWSPKLGLFSSKINELSRMDEMIGTIARSLRLRESAAKITQKLLATGIQRGDVSKVIADLSETTRLAAKNAGDIDMYRSVMRDVNQAQRQISRLVDPDTSTLRRAYKNVVDAAMAGNQRILERSAQYATYFKQKYNAERIADTEFSRAYGNTVLAEAHYDEDVTCVRVVLSSAHVARCVCNFYANADLYGRGKGVYPKDRLPDFPFHPHCRCVLEPIYEIEAPAASEKDFNSRGGERYLRSLSEGERKSLLGVAGSEEFRKNPGAWEEQLRGYQHPVKQTPKIEEDVFIT